MVSTVRGGGAGLLVAGAAGALAIAAGAVIARDAAAFNDGETWISQGGTPHGTLRARWLGYRNVATWGARELLDPRRTMWVVTAYKAEAEARRLENELFHGGERQFGTKLRIGYDNGPDAFRHTYASAAIVYRLMRERGASTDDAVRFLHAAGNAHERDSWLHAHNQAHGRFSSEMDVNNNLLGHRIGAMLATRHAAEGVDLLTGEAQLRRAVLEAIGGGILLDGDTRGIARDRAGRSRATVMDRIDARPRIAGWHDIAQLESDGHTPRRTAVGDPVLRVHAPDAPGFPTPIRDGRVDLSMPHASLGPAQLRIPRSDTPQA